MSASELDNVDFRLLFESSPDELLVLLPDSPRFTIVAATEARLRATQTTREATIGRPLFEIFPDNPETPDANGSSNLRASLERVLATHAPDPMAVQRYDIRGPNGQFETRYWSPKNTPILSAEGHVLYILHRAEDVTELVQATELGHVLRDKTQAMEREVLRRSQELSDANRELRTANERLGQLDAAKTALLANVSHEFRTPLTLMLAPLEDALERGAPLGAAELNSIHRNAARLHRLVNGLLEFSRLEAGRQEPLFAPTDLATLTAGLAGAFHSLMTSGGLELRVHCPPLGEPVWVDVEMWEKTVANLLSNAFKFTERGRVSVELRAAGERVELVVRDTGIGIPADHLPRIFERFHRVEGAPGRSIEGTGIGLALVREFVKLHRGDITVESTVGQGSTFIVSLPRSSAHVPKEIVEEWTNRREPGGTVIRALLSEAANWQEGAPLAELGATPDAARVLVVDDNSDLRNYIASLLGRHWRVETAADGEAALERIRRAPPDLVLSDVMMPRLDGVGLVRAVRAAAETRHLPVILLSARAGEEAVVQGLEAGADDYLVKPFSARELVTRVRACLETARSRTSALRASEMRFRRLAESGMMGIVVLDQAGRALEANDTFLNMVGWSRADLRAGANVSDLLGGRRQASSAPHQTWEAECRARDGRRVPILVALAPLEHGENIAVTIDLTEKKRLEAQFRQSQKMEAVGRLAAGIAHDFNNVLSVIMTCAELMRGDLGSGSDLGPDLEEITKAAHRASELTQQLLAFSRQQVLAPRVLSLWATLTRLEKMLRRLLGADVELTILSDSGLWSIEADPGQIEQIIMNLAVNARDAMPGGGMLTIETANVTLDESYANEHHDVRPGEFVMLAMSDTGEGMDTETQARIFEPFFTTKSQGKGTGLGLATVFGIVKQSGGHIWVYSEPGRGATFKVYFPRTSTVESTSEVKPSAPKSEGGHEVILLVEDDPQVRAVACTVLRKSGYVVLEASNGGEAFIIAEQRGTRIDLLLTDVVLPLMNGRLVAERIQNLRPNVRVLFMSGYTDNAVLQHGVLDSGSAFLQKPITAASLTRKVREVLDRPSR
ncbi:MAG: ATP-binding protein [Polyangiaceae bacterium]